MKSAHESGVQWQTQPIRLASKERIAELKTLLKELRLQIEQAPKVYSPAIKSDKKE